MTPDQTLENEVISPQFEREIRRFIRACYLHGHADEWIDSLGKAMPNPTIRSMVGVSRQQTVDLIIDEVEKFRATIDRERELAETLSPTKTLRF